MTGAHADAWILVEPAHGLARVTGLALTPIPVRAARVPALFGTSDSDGGQDGGQDDGKDGGRDGSQVDLAGLADELDVFVGEQPERLEALTPSMLRLTTAAADEALDASDWAGAERLVRRARRWAPDDLGLQVQLGRALHGLGRHSEATAAWQRAIEGARERTVWSPMLWLLTGRALMELGDDRGAAALLDEICERHDDERVLRLRDSVARRVRQGGRR